MAADSEARAGVGYRILIENSEHWLRNNGDLAMMDITIQRVRKRWPEAQIGVVTELPALLTAYFPDAKGINPYRTDPWSTPGPIERVAAKFGPALIGPIAVGQLRARSSLRERARKFRDEVRKVASRKRSSPAQTAPTGDAVRHVAENGNEIYPGAHEAARQATLVLALGGGYLTDSDLYQANRVLNVLEEALEAGVPVALVGQGLGPMRDSDLRSRAADVLPRTDFISLRERRRGPDLLAELGVTAGKTLVTGDDAIELAYTERRVEAGSDIGVCLRVAEYAPVPRDAQDVVGRTVRAMAAEFRCGLVPLIIAEHPGSPDRATTLPLVRGAAEVTAPLGRFVQPRLIAARVSQCRILVTGAYHLAVFALAQGIPVVACTSTEYYDDKFLGLADMFGDGLRLIHLNDELLAKHLEEAIRAAWSSADDTRDSLLERAVEQIDASVQAFEQVFALAESGSSGEGAGTRDGHS